MESISDFALFLQDQPDEVLADAYEQYMDDRGSRWFHDIFWEANRRGLTLDDLEQIFINSLNNSTQPSL